MYDVVNILEIVGVSSFVLPFYYLSILLLLYL